MGIHAVDTSLILPLSMIFGLIAWGLLFRVWVHPELGPRPFADAVRPLLLLNVFRYVGLAFLLPGVTAEPLDPRFAVPAAYGDLVAATLALLALGAVRVNRSAGLAAVWLFNVWGLADLVNAVAQGLRHTPDGALGATFWIPAVFVPLLVVVHLYLFARLLRETAGPARPRIPANDRHSDQVPG